MKVLLLFTKRQVSCSNKFGRIQSHKIINNQRLKSFIQEQVDFARENGYVETISGRRRYLKDINSANAIVRGGAERNAVNAPIQGSAADIIKIAMINIHKKLTSENWKSKMLLQVHDELVFDVHNSELEKIQPMIKHEMENAFKMAVPLDVEIGLGKNWLEAHQKSGQYSVAVGSWIRFCHFDERQMLLSLNYDE